jgi:hypothetical protein
MSGGAYASGVADLPLSSCPDRDGSPAVVYLARNQRTDLPWDASGGGSLIDSGQP